jgi:hypothetical protein
VANHYIAINRGKSGFAINDFTFAAASTAGADIELRIADLDANGKPLTRLDVVKALEAFERVMTSGKTYTGFPVL